MKTKQANKDYRCAECTGIIHKGDRVARRTVTIGYMGTWGHGKECKCCYGVMPDSAATTPLREVMPICENCANGTLFTTSSGVAP
jgi:hypothetical protein